MGQVTAIVTGVVAGRASVECGEPTQSACGACAAGRGCGWQRSNPPRHLDIAARQGLRELQPGDRVELHIDDSRLLWAACRLYLPPLAGLLAGPALLRIAGWEQGGLPLLAAAFGLVTGGLIARRWTREAVPVSYQWLGSPEIPGPSSS